MRWLTLAFSAALVVALLPAVDAQSKSKSAPKKAPAKKVVKPAPKPSAERGLVGINLYDSGLKVIQKFGNPEQIQALSFGGNAVGPSGGGEGGGRGPAGAAERGGGGGGRRDGGDLDRYMSPNISSSPLDFANDLLRQGQPIVEAAEGGNNRGGGGTAGRPGGGGERGGGGGAGTGGGTGERATYTRWVYNKGNSKYGFIIDKFMRVVQVEAIGMNDGRVKTQRGIRYGSTFSDIIRKYNAPDAYEINGENITVRYLVRWKVAFRLSRLGPNKPHVVTGIVVAGGKQ